LWCCAGWPSRLVSAKGISTFDERHCTCEPAALGVTAEDDERGYFDLVEEMPTDASGNLHWTALGGALLVVLRWLVFKTRVSTKWQRHLDVMGGQTYLWLLGPAKNLAVRELWGIRHGSRGTDRYLWVLSVVWVAEVALAKIGGETPAAFKEAGTCCGKPRAVARLLEPQASRCGPGNMAVTLVPRRLHSLACGMAAGRVRVTHWKSGPCA